MSRSVQGLRRVASSRRPGLLARVACVAACASCVTYEVEPDADEFAVGAIAVPVAIPITGMVTGASGSPDLVALDAYYGSVIAQLQDALVERDPEQIVTLLAVHDRPFAPTWARDLMAQFRALSQTLDFELHAARTATLEIEGDAPPIGEVVPLRFGVRSSSVAGVSIPGVDRAEVPARVLVAVVVTDFDCFGGTAQRRFSEILPTEKTVRFDSGDTWQLPFGLPALPAEGCRRTIDVSCELLAGNLLLDGDVVPNRGARLVQRSFELFPKGIENVLGNPYTHLRNGLELADPKHFGNVFLAARVMPPEFREDAMRRLVGALRNGRGDVQRLCMASLREMTGLDISVEDRDAWLAWWQRR